MICPKCKKDTAELMHDGIWHPSYKIVCSNCGCKTGQYDTPSGCTAEWNVLKSNIKINDCIKSEHDPNNPYTDFAKEMSLLHEALKAEGFKDAMVDILAKMTPIVWDKVERKKKHERLKEAVKKLDKVEYQPPGWLETIPKEVEVRLE